MKLAFIFMFMLNMSFFGWQYFIVDVDNRPVAESSQTDGRYDTITLLHEAGKFIVKDSEKEKEKPESISSRIGEATDKKTELAKNEIVNCFKLGPYNKQAQAEQARAKMIKMGAVVSINTEEKKERFRYWVLDATSTHNIATRKIKKYRDKGIEDVYLIREGKKKDNISLGIFRARATAQKRLSELKSHGFSPIVEKHYKIKTEYWLIISETIRSPLTESSWESIIRNTEGISKSDENC